MTKLRYGIKKDNRELAILTSLAKWCEGTGSCDWIRKLVSIIDTD